MTNFNENILSKIIARRIIAPEDRSNLLPLATPIYCPDANGVKASRVTIIDPNANTLFTSDDFLSVGSQWAAGLNPAVIEKGTPNISSEGIYNGTDQNYIQFDLSKHSLLTIICNFEPTDGSILGIIGGQYITGTGHIGNLIKVEIDSTNSLSISAKLYYTNQNDPVVQNFSDLPLKIISLVGFRNVDLTQSTIDNQSLFGTKTVTKQPGSIKNTVDIDLNNQLNVKYFIPSEVELETNVDLVDFLKADAAVKFKHEVSTKIHDQIQALVEGNLISQITMGTTLAETLGTVITKLIKDGTGQRYSIYKYNNGAPIEYITSNYQPNIDRVVDKQDNFYNYNYASIDDINIPALYFFEKPSLILDNAKFEDYQQGLCDGSIKRYVEEKLNVDTTADTMTSIGEGIFGTNDCFAVAFTQPSIQRKPSQDFFGDELYITIYYGVKLISKANLGYIA